MKIFKKSQTGEMQNLQNLEKVSPLETPDRQQYEMEDELKQSKLKPPFYTAEVLKQISTLFPDKINSIYMASGSVAWFEINGKLYEITVEPASLGRYYSYIKNKTI